MTHSCSSTDTPFGGHIHPLQTIWLRDREGFKLFRCLNKVLAHMDQESGPFNIKYVAYVVLARIIRHPDIQK